MGGARREEGSVLSTACGSVLERPAVLRLDEGRLPVTPRRRLRALRGGRTGACVRVGSDGKGGKTGSVRHPAAGARGPLELRRSSTEDTHR